jgi:mannose-1-phosphate guanylyltransferase
MMRIAAIILAGGLGSRLWPRSTERTPKQFVHVLGDGTLIQNTVMRLMPFVSTEDVYLVTPRDMVHHVSEQLPVLKAANIFVEPFGRNTGPSIALSATLLRERIGDDGVMIVLPADHIISSVREFQNTLELATSVAGSTNNIVTIGVAPTRADTGYGYIQVGEEFVSEGGSYPGVVHRVRTFAEKPDIATAQRFIDAGDFVWNSGIFVGKVGTILSAIERHLPDHAPLFSLLTKHIGTDLYSDFLENVFKQIRSVSFDIGVMEKARNVCVVDGTFGWSDVGTWDELYRLSMKDGRNNVIEGNVVTLNSNSCLVYGTSARVIGVVGVDNLVVVETDSAVMICRRGQTEQVKDLVDLLRRRHIGNRS